jgi:hypothetical protein
LIQFIRLIYRFFNKNKGFSLPVVSQLTNINYTLSLSSDPLPGPYTTNVNLTTGETITIRLNQCTAGPISNVSVSFGDGTPSQSYTLVSSYVNISYIYMTAGTYTIVASPVALSLNAAITVNTITVVVTGPPAYQSKT